MTVKKTAAKISKPKAAKAKTSTKPQAATAKKPKAPARKAAKAQPAQRAKETPTTKPAAKKRAKASSKTAKQSAGNGLSAEREQVLRKSARKKNGSAEAAVIAQERARQALESISVVRHDNPDDGNGAAARKKRYTQRELKSFRDMLLRVREQLVEQVQSLRSASLTRDDAVNSEEDGTDAFERQLALKLASDEGDSIFEIDEALQRIDEGTYGTCQECGCLIGKPRLKALPFTGLCIACRSASEKLNHNHAHR